MNEGIPTYQPFMLHTINSTKTNKQTKNTIFLDFTPDNFNLEFQNE